MDPATISAIILAVVAIVTLGITYLQRRETHGDRLGSKLDNKIKNLIEEQTKPFGTQLGDHTLRFAQNDGRLGRIEDLCKDIAISQRKTADEMIEVKVKQTMYGSALEQLAMNAAKTLHMPDPERRRVDRLLEAFMEGTLSEDERNELRKILVLIRNYEIDHTATPEENRRHAIEQFGFPIVPGDQTYAVILLSTMDVVDPRRIASLGHAAHRAHGPVTIGE